ncbi:MAG TPA: cyclase family protein [Alphaproteobacteria bacterium]|nr:cyclase family protein [Alphaproteobacteria bacterium]
MAEEAWRRWGEEDEQGALNQIGPDQVRRAASLVKTGRVISLAQPIADKTPVPAMRQPVMHLMNRDGGDYAAGAKRPGGVQVAEDTLIIPVHLATHIDALCHVWYDDKLYNGFSGNGTRSGSGATRCGVEKFTPLVTRGLFFDVVKHRGAAPKMGEIITADELKEIGAKAGFAPEPGDAVLIRTGWWEEHGNKPDYFDGEPGIDVEGAEWLAEAGVSLVAMDNYAIEVIPFPAGTVFPVHQRLLRDYGVPLMEGLILTELAASGATQFMFTAAPLPVKGATGSPLTPLAVF